MKMEYAIMGGSLTACCGHVVYAKDRVLRIEHGDGEHGDEGIAVVCVRPLCIAPFVEADKKLDAHHKKDELATIAEVCATQGFEETRHEWKGFDLGVEVAANHADTAQSLAQEGKRRHEEAKSSSEEAQRDYADAVAARGAAPVVPSEVGTHKELVAFAAQQREWARMEEVVLAAQERMSSARAAAGDEHTICRALEDDHARARAAHAKAMDLRDNHRPRMRRPAFHAAIEWARAISRFEGVMPTHIEEPSAEQVEPPDPVTT